MAAGATTASLLWADRFQMAYLISHAAGVGDSSCNIDGSSAVTPDLATDAATVVNSHLAGLMTALYADQAAARAAFGMGTATGTNPVLSLDVDARASVLDMDVKVDADVTAPNGHPRLTVHAMNEGTAVLVIRRPHSRGR